MGTGITHLLKPPVCTCLEELDNLGTRATRQRGEDLVSSALGRQVPHIWLQAMGWPLQPLQGRLPLGALGRLGLWFFQSWGFC